MKPKQIQKRERLRNSRKKIYIEICQAFVAEEEEDAVVVDADPFSLMKTNPLAYETEESDDFVFLDDCV